MDRRSAKNLTRNSRAGGPGGSSLPFRRLCSMKTRERVLNRSRDCHGQLVSSIIEALDLTLGFGVVCMLQCISNVAHKPSMLWIGRSAVDTDAGADGYPTITANVWLHFRGNLAKVNKFVTYLKEPDEIHSYLGKSYIKPEAFHLNRSKFIIFRHI